MRRLCRSLAALAVSSIAVIAGMASLAVPPAGATSYSRINGNGSTYVGLAMQQWVADIQTRGLSVNYLPTGSPQGLTDFGQNLTDFAGTEAEYSALGGAPPPRGYQYVPDVAGAIAVMYNVQDKAGRKVDYLHLARQTVARIFIGDITTWADPAITADNKGLLLPDQPITVVYRGGQSGTTALFYDFVQHTVPDVFGRWAAKNQLPTTVRIIQLDSAPHFAPNTLNLSGSDQIAQSVASPQGLWSIAYDEFGYAKTYGAPAAWIQNASGAYVQPYAQNISAALQSAHLRPDLSQDLSAVYTSGDPLAYPISAYSYVVTQCAHSPDRATCQGVYTNPGVAATLATWMRYIACEGQVNMARIGYSPLPTNLSQEMANSIGRMQGTPPEQLNAANCANPRFTGSLGQGATSPRDPLVNLPAQGNGGTGSGGHTGSAGGGAAGGGSTGTGASSSGAGGTSAAGTSAAGGGQNGAAAVGGSAGGSDGATSLNNGAPLALGGNGTAWRAAAAVVYNRPIGGGIGLRPLILLAVLLAMPPLIFWLRGLR